MLRFIVLLLKLMSSDSSHQGKKNMMHLLLNDNPIYFSPYAKIWASKLEPISHIYEKLLAQVAPGEQMSEMTFGGNSSLMTTKGLTSMLLDPALNQNMQSNVILSFLISFQFLFLQNFPLQSCHIISIILCSFHFHLFL